MNKVNDSRRRELARIHIAQKELGMDRATYEDMLWTIARVRSSADLDAAGRKAVLHHLKACGFKGKRGRNPRKGTPRKDTPQLRKIEALLADTGRPWSYGHAIARRICKVERLEWCKPDDLRKIIAALEYDRKRRS
jgi:phage gp16-like protein